MRRRAARWTGSRRPVLVTNPGAELYGSDRMMLETVTALVGAGDRVLVAVPGAGPLLDQVEQRGGRPVVMSTAILRKDALRPAGMIRLLRDAVGGLLPAISLIRRERPRLIIVNTIITPIWLVAARLTRTPVICHVHEGETGRSPLLRRALVLPLLLADRLIVNSRFSRGVLLDSLPRLARRSVVVYNAVQGPPAVTAPRSDIEGAVRLLYVGRLSPRKGPDIVVDAVAELADRGIEAELDIVGAVFSGYEWFEEGLRSRVADRQLGDRVRFHGFSDNVWGFAADADISLVPSTADEPFGNTAVEAALAGRPLIVSATSGLLEASDGLHACIGVAPGSPVEIADAIEKILANWSQFADDAVRDAQRTAERYAPARYAADVLQSVAAVGRQPAPRRT
ncbi:glycosyltransferase family 4 protein [Microlunatus soli]|uniref:Glycosyltransferase involved in cell wall bisynthesis n=1 Tax=Microlunatus soli TaxID=630515 RepID=A0A1H1SQQ1_9ACTN|nr:glycosyltransferase family 4 protein [Microlunatus soli]SDS50337.1 Glycosyltransferase involved in cell wall bisynthesis [Microlunatus soli]